MLFSFESIIKGSLYPPMHHAISARKIGQHIVAAWYSASYETSSDTVIYMSQYERIFTIVWIVFLNNNIL